MVRENKLNQYAGDIAPDAQEFLNGEAAKPSVSKGKAVAGLISKPKYTSMSVSIPENELKRVDKAVKAIGTDRSKLVAALLKDFCDENGY